MSNSQKRQEELLQHPKSARDLRPSERNFVAAMSAVWFGRFEDIRVEAGELVLDPWPKTVHAVKFGLGHSGPTQTIAAEFDLKNEVVQLFESVRSLNQGRIIRLDIRHGLPSFMEIEHAVKMDSC